MFFFLSAVSLIKRFSLSFRCPYTDGLKKENKTCLERTHGLFSFQWVTVQNAKQRPLMKTFAILYMNFIIFRTCFLTVSNQRLLQKVYKAV